MPPNFRTPPNLSSNVSDERLQQLCREAAAEHDPARMLKLIEQINELLESKARPPERQRPHVHPAT